MGNVELLGSRSPINGRGSLIHQENKRQLSCTPSEVPDASRQGLLPFGQVSAIWRYALLRDTKMLDVLRI